MATEEEEAMLLILITNRMVELEEKANEAMLLAAASLIDAKAEKRAARKLRKRKHPAEHITPRGERRPAGTGKRQKRERSYVTEGDGDVNYFALTGLTAAKFRELLELLRPALMQGRSTTAGTASGIARSWTVHTRLFMTLYWLRHYPTYACLAAMFGGSVASISREIRDTILKMYVHLRVIKWPDGPVSPIFNGAAGAIDCTSHLRWRSHPWSSLCYRSDVHAHFLSSQLICSLSGPMWDVQLGLGHNNDQGMFNKSQTHDKLIEKDMTLLADGGYSSARIISPSDCDGETRRAHAGFRSVVEQNFALIHSWRASGGVFRQDIEMQEMVISVIYNLVAFKQSPLRHV